MQKNDFLYRVVPKFDDHQTHSIPEGEGLEPIVCTLVLSMQLTVGATKLNLAYFLQKLIAGF